MREFLIWSEEHGRWWRPGHRGYTDRIAEAGRYGASAAEQIVREANYGHTFNEIAIPVGAELHALLRRSRGGDHAAIERGARELERQVNARLAELHPCATDHEVEAVIQSILPDGWEWVDATMVSGTRQIVLTRYGRLS